MLVVRADIEIPSILMHLDSVISIGMETGAFLVAANIQQLARDVLTERITASGGHETGRLSSAILVKNANTGLRNYTRWDVVVDINRAPYAMWIELGRTAPSKMLPYAKSEDRDYSKSKFIGHKYLTEALKIMSSKGNAASIVHTAIMAALANPIHYKSIGNTIEV